MSEYIRKMIDKVNNFNRFVNENIGSDIKLDIDFVYNQYPELSNIGTQEQYSQYLNTIFPRSNVKNIVYHDTRSEEIEGGQLKPSTEGVYGAGIYVQTKRDFTGTFGPKTLSLIIDTKKAFPFHLGVGGESNSVWKKIVDKHKNSKKYYWADIAKEEFIEYVIDNGYDAIKTTEGGGNTYYILFNPEQTHILGSEKDVEGFKKFVKK